MQEHKLDVSPLQDINQNTTEPYQGHEYGYRDLIESVIFYILEQLSAPWLVGLTPIH